MSQIERPTVHTALASFEAARRLPHGPGGQPRLHGHGFLARIHATLPDSYGGFAGAQVHALTQALQAACQQLDYRELNEVLAEPSDARLAQWIGEQVSAPATVGTSVQSTRDQGVVVVAHGAGSFDGPSLERVRPLGAGAQRLGGTVTAWRRYRFQAAHRLPNVPFGHKCGRMHGHGFQVVLHAQNTSYDDIDTAWAPLHIELNYGCLNDKRGLENPTSEMLSSWLWARLIATLPGLTGVSVYETGSCGAHYDGAAHRIWKDFTVDSAALLCNAPPDHPLARLHGYTYTLRMHLGALLDARMGWTLDFGDVKALFNPIFKGLDHHPLHELGAVPQPDSASLARWIFEQARARLPQTSGVDLFETRGTGAMVHLGGEGLCLPL